jgi:putative (di)nucleoside polyphosphate hydrolase
MLRALLLLCSSIALLQAYAYGLGMEVTPKEYRSGVVAVFVNDHDDDETPKVLVCKRKGSPEWQFPQGGLEDGETYEQALFREILEELGNHQFKILQTSQTLVQYDFPGGMKGALALKYRGQQHQWFLCQYEHGSKPNLEHASDDDFEDVAWVYPRQALKTIVRWKRPAYVRGLEELGGLLERVDG